jgi:hypothetical protein
MSVKGYEIGEINAKAAWSAEFWIDVPGASLQDVVNLQDIERREMDARLGMLIKYVPNRFDAINGRHQIGGLYLFDTKENVEAYGHWTTNEFEVGEPKTKFWSRPIFKDVEKYMWEVVGAHNFSTPEDHQVVHWRRWKYSGDAAPYLKDMYMEVKTSAEKEGLRAVWMLHHPQEKMIGILRVAARHGEGDDPLVDAHTTMAKLERAPSVGKPLQEKISAKSIFERTSLVLATWMPMSRKAGGVHQITPNTPLLPGVTVPKGDMNGH